MLIICPIQHTIGLFINPFPHMTPLQQTKFLKTWLQEKKLLKTSNFSFSHHVFNYFHLLYFHLKKVSKFFWVCFQSRLLQICCMWEMVKELFPLTKPQLLKKAQNKRIRYKLGKQKQLDIDIALF